MQFMGNTLMFANWVQFEMGKTLKTKRVYHNKKQLKKFPYFLVVENEAQFLISNFTLIKDVIFELN